MPVGTDVVSVMAACSDVVCVCVVHCAKKYCTSTGLVRLGGKCKDCAVTCQVNTVGGGRIALPIHSLGTKKTLGCQRQAQAVLPLGREPIPEVHKAGWTLGTFWTGTEYPACTGFQKPAHSKGRMLLYRINTSMTKFNSKSHCKAINQSITMPSS